MRTKIVVTFIALLLVVCCLCAACEKLSDAAIDDITIPFETDLLTDTPSQQDTTDLPTDTPSQQDTEETPAQEEAPAQEDVIHAHIYSDDWSSDDEYHWHAAICGHDATSDREPHRWDDGAVTTPSTQDEQGTKTYACLVCDAKKTESIEKLSHVHTYGDWETETPADCIREGTEVRRCACGETEHRTVAAKGHTEVTDPAVLPTCTEAGSTEGSHCGVCGVVLHAQEPIAAKGHAFGDYVTTKDPTCTKDGEETATCSICKLSRSHPLPALGHDYLFDSFIWENNVAKAKCVCAHDATHVVYRDVKMRTETISGTCERQGVLRYVATFETHTDSKSETLENIGHDYIPDVTAPTCLEGGYTTYVCSRCGNSYVADDTDALGHRYGEWSTVTDPTCEGVGEERRTCTACGDVQTRAIAALGHHYQGNVTAPTCTVGGYTAYDCSRCGANYVADNTDPLGHDLVEHPAQAPTCNEIGWAAYNACSRCDFSSYEAIPATGHTFDGGYFCTVCDEEAPPTDGIVFTAAGDGTYGVSAYNGGSTNVYIPHTYDGSPVTRIDAAAFAGSSVTSVVVSDSVTTIGSGAFAGCTALERIILPFVGGSIGAENASASTLFGYIFGTAEHANCTETRQYYSSMGSAIYFIPNSLRSVTITGGRVLYGAFYGCAALTDVKIGENASILGKCAFAGCSSLETLTLPFVGDRANVGPMDTYQYPLGYLFGSLSYENADYVSQYYFASSPFAPTQSFYYVPSSLRLVSVSGGKVLYGAFSGLTSSLSVVLAEGVTSIENAAFANAEGLTDVTIPRSVTYIGNDAFSGCTALTDLYYQGTTEEWDSVTKAAEWAHNAPAFTVHCLNDLDNE